MRLRMAVFLFAGSVGLAGCTAGPGAYTASPAYSGGYGYGYDTGAYGYASGAPGSACRSATGLRIRRPRLLRGAGLGVGPRRGLASAHWQNNAEAQPRQQEQPNAAMHRQQVQQDQATYQRQVQENAAKYQLQVQQNQATYQRQVQENAAKYQQQVQQNQAIVQQNAALYRQQVQQNTAIYQRQLLEAQQRKAAGQQ